MHEAPLPKTLNDAETQELEECETIIRNGRRTFLDVGNALARVRAKRLYRDRYETFEQYCWQMWEFSKTHANRLIGAVEVAAVLEPIGVKVESESQARELTRLEPKQIPKAWKKAEEIAGGGAITAKVVRLAVREIDPKQTPKSATAAGKKGSDQRSLDAGLKLIDKAESALDREDWATVRQSLKRIRKLFLQRR